MESPISGDADRHRSLFISAAETLYGEPERISRGRPPIDLHCAIAGVLAISSTYLIAADSSLPVVRVLAGVYLMIVLPAQLIRTKVAWGASRPWETSIYSVVLAILLCVVSALIINFVLPITGVVRPLDRVPVLCTQLAVIVSLALWRRGPLRGRKPETANDGAGVKVGTSDASDSAIDLAFSLASIALIPLAVAGAIRLNNGATGVVTEVMLAGDAAILLALVLFRERVHERTILRVLYLSALALVLMTSLRGWYITGHDIQREYRVFGLTSANGNWDISRYRDPYNACMSITILPTSVTDMTGISDIYAFKLAIPVLFALCAPIIYLISRRFASRILSILAATYFIAFPTFFTDMPFMARQEVAFVFLGAVLLVATNTQMPLRRRQAWALVFSVGVILSHYSTTYVLIGVLVAAVFIDLVHTLLRRYGRDRNPLPNIVSEKPVLGLTYTVVVIVLTTLWAGPATNTGGQLEETAAKVVSAFSGTGGVRSSDVAYNLFATSRPSLTERLADYRRESLGARAPGPTANGYYPLDEVDRYPTPIVGAENLPLTASGKFLSRLGVNVSAFNTAIRQTAAKLLQVFVFVGLCIVLTRRSKGLRVTSEFYYLAWGSFLVVLSQVVLPAVSVQYGILRAFQQSLFLLGPFLAAGSVFIFKWAGSRAAELGASAVFLVFFLSLTGVLPQTLGGYPPQLHLNNAGIYYDDFYLHPEERVAIEWLQSRLPAGGQSEVQSEVETDRYTFSRVREYSGLNSYNDLYPTLLRRDSYVFLGYGTTTKRQASVFYDGDVLTYKYPIALLDNVKSRVYSSGGASIYK